MDNNQRKNGYSTRVGSCVVSLSGIWCWTPRQLALLTNLHTLRAMISGNGIVG